MNLPNYHVNPDYITGVRCGHHDSLHPGRSAL